MTPPPPPPPTQQTMEGHSRNKTGIVGHHQKEWSKDPEVNERWRKLSVPEPLNKDQIQKSFVRHVITTLARTYFNLDNRANYEAAAHTIRDKLISSWDETQQKHTRLDVKRVYYLSMEFLMGRSLGNAILNMGIKGLFGASLTELGVSMETVVEEERDAALGNGGLGRLAACFMDSLATLNMPAWGYGIRYTYGIFKQQISADGSQVEIPDYWLTLGNPWEVERLDVCYEVRFGGTISSYGDDVGNDVGSGVDVNSSTTSTTSTNNNKKHQRMKWEGGDLVEAVAYDVPIPGFGTTSTINIRLWKSEPVKRFDLPSFNAGNYQRAVEQQQMAENITSVLYPSDSTVQGKELRLRQQYFFVSATLQDIIRRFKKSNREWNDFPHQVAIQLNDTHPSIGIVELMRILLDEEELEWDEAWAITVAVHSFTNHTILPEAMEKWPLHLMESLLPRHLPIIFDINQYFLEQVQLAFPDDLGILERMSLIEEGHVRMVRMAHLAIVGSHTVNGVAKIHTQIIIDSCFKDFVAFYGKDKFQNKTNGITPRRWLQLANPALTELYTECLIEGGHVSGGSAGGFDETTNNNCPFKLPEPRYSWLKDLDVLRRLEPLAASPAFQKRWLNVKRDNKIRLSNLIYERCGIICSADAIFDVQVKRLHEYKRQFMNILSVIYRYLRLREALVGGDGTTSSKNKNSNKNISTTLGRVVIFGGKAAPSYTVAKLIIKLINQVSIHLSKDPLTSSLLQVVFIPDYNVSLAEAIIPGTDISQHISTAGTEASGTSNMKFVLNGSLIIGTLDGANVEIVEEVGTDGMFIFGALASQVEDIRNSQRLLPSSSMDPKLREVIDFCKSGAMFPYTAEWDALFAGIIDVANDYYLISHDFSSYLQAQDRVDAAYLDQQEWARVTILSSLRMGKFSSDRAIKEYAKDIWGIQGVCE